ncbi:MAG: hypothetical protein HOV67_11015 [Kribbellaceae bacterium]|nr:hypothetical protein [Kribbellaceae bacterium]
MPHDVGVHGQGVRLTTGAVEGKHVGRSERLPGRLGCREVSQFGQELLVVPERQLGSQAKLLRCQLGLVESAAQTAAYVVCRDVRESRTAPQSQGVCQQLAALLQVVLTACLLDERPELLHVGLSWRGTDRVAVTPACQLDVEYGAQAGHVDLQSPPGVRR